MEEIKFRIDWLAFTVHAVDEVAEYIWGGLTGTSTASRYKGGVLFFIGLALLVHQWAEYFSQLG